MDYHNWLAEKETNDRIQAMSGDEMEALLKELSSSKFFIAILKYIQGRIIQVQSGLYSVDPFKDPTQLARYQGIVTGILDMPDAVSTLLEKAEKAENPESKK